MSLIPPLLGLLIGGTAAAGDEAACAEALAAAHAALDEGPVVKDEIATAVMWLRLDAEAAAAAGEHDVCVEKAATALTLTLNNQGRGQGE